MTARAQSRMLTEVKKNPRVSAKDLQKSLEHANISVDESTMHKTLNKNGVQEGHHRRSHCCPKKTLHI
jgi:predicted RNA binding protein YcfA (HicA-like mRNA interferase family)